MLRRPLCVRSGVTVTITGANFFKPGDGDGRVHVRWVLDTSPQTGEALTFYLSFADFVSASTLVTLSPKIPESFTEDTRYTDTAGVTDAYIQLSYNGGTTWDSIVQTRKFLFFRRPSLNFAYLLCWTPCEYFENHFPTYLEHPYDQDTRITAADRAQLTRTRTMPQSGSWSDGSTSQGVFVYLNVSNVFLRLYDAVCIFAPCANGVCGTESAAEDLVGCVAKDECSVVTATFVRDGNVWTRLSSSAIFATEAEIACEAPPLRSGRFRISFSANRLATDDEASFAATSDRGWALPDDTGIATDDALMLRESREQIGFDTSFGWLSLVSKACPDGYVASSERVSCTPCPPGSVASRSGTSCEECPFDFYQPYAAQSGACHRCPTSMGTNRTGCTSERDCRCIEGLYQSTSWSDAQGASELCSRCPDSAVCPGGLHLPYPVEGHFREDPHDRQLRPIDSMLSCLPPIACVGGEDSACADGYDGVACADCAPGYYRFSHYCERCPTAAQTGKLYRWQYATYIISIFVLIFCEPWAQAPAFWSVLSFAQVIMATSRLELMWQGAPPFIFRQSNGVLEKIFETTHSPRLLRLFKAFGGLAPALLWPQLTQTAAMQCSVGESEAPLHLIWLPPLVLVLLKEAQRACQAVGPQDRWKVLPVLCELSVPQMLVGSLVPILALLPSFFCSFLDSMICSRDEIKNVGCLPHARAHQIIRSIALALVGFTGYLLLELQHGGVVEQLRSREWKGWRLVGFLLSYPAPLQLRTCLIVLQSFFGGNGVYQAGMSNGVLLCWLCGAISTRQLSVVVARAHQLGEGQPTAKEDLGADIGGMLSTYSLIFLLFAGVISSIGALPGEAWASLLTAVAAASMATPILAVGFVSGYRQLTPFLRFVARFDKCEKTGDGPKTSRASFAVADASPGRDWLDPDGRSGDEPWRLKQLLHASIDPELLLHLFKKMPRAERRDALKNLVAKLRAEEEKHQRDEDTKRPRRLSLLGAFDDRVDEAAAPDDERSCGLGCGPEETNQDLGIRVIGRSLWDRMVGNKSESSELGSDLGSDFEEDKEDEPAIPTNRAVAREALEDDDSDDSDYSETQEEADSDLGQLVLPGRLGAQGERQLGAPDWELGSDLDSRHRDAARPALERSDSDYSETHGEAANSELGVVRERQPLELGSDLDSGLEEDQGDGPRRLTSTAAARDALAGDDSDHSETNSVVDPSGVLVSQKPDEIFF